MLRAVAYEGTPHYAGPVGHHMNGCLAIRVKIDVPGGRRLTDQWVYGPCS